jgi:predicted phage-related endonuclease
MWCADLPRCYVTVGFSGWKSRTYIVDRDQEDIDTIVKACSTFWHDHVLTGIMPPVDDSPDTARILRMIHQADPGRVVTAPSAVAGYIEILRNVKADIKALEERKTMLDNLIMAALGDATELVDPAGDLLATWRQSKDGTVFDMDRFRIDHPEMVATYQKIKHGNRPLLIKPIKGE